MAKVARKADLSLPKAAGSRAVDIVMSASNEDLQKTLLEDRVVSNEEALRLLYDFTYWARPEQLPPPGDWRVWLICTGRAWGKSRTGSEYIRQRAYDGHGPIAIIGKTAADCRDIMILGPAGIIACSPPWFKPVWEPSKRRLTWPNGIYATTFGGDEPDQLRGPQHSTGWVDELCLVGRTLLFTQDGPIFIEDAISGMSVWTRRGLRKIAGAKMTSPSAEILEATFSDGRILRGTAGHPVWVEGKGFVPLANLKFGDRVLCFARESEFGGMVGCGTEITWDITGVGREEEGCQTSSYTERSGSIQGGQFQTGLLFTTSAEIHQTTGSSICKCCPPPNIPSCIQKKGRKPVESPAFSGREQKDPEKCGRSGGRRHSRRCALYAERSTQLSPGQLKASTAGKSVRTPAIIKNPTTGLWQKKESASAAAVNTTAATCALKPARSSVERRCAEEDSGLQTLKGRSGASRVGNSSPPEALSRLFAPEGVHIEGGLTVESVRNTGAREAVYNIEVEGCPEYFANGILVHNCKFSAPDDVFSNFEMGLRVGNDPRAIITTTPRPIRIMRQLLADPQVYVQRGHSYENRANLPPDFIERVERRYAGTRLGRQELGGEMLDDTPGALWTLGKTIDPYRVKSLDVPSLRQIVVGVDPSATDYDPDDEDRRGSECGIVVAGIGGREDHGYVLEDGSDSLSPGQWAERVVEMYYRHAANYVVAERNNGGGMVRETIHAVDDRVPVLLVWASTGKETRAEPVSLLYEQGRIHHVGTLPELEDQMCSFVPRDKKRQPSDRMDALVWCIKHLMLGDDKLPHYDPTKHRIDRWRRPE